MHQNHFDNARPAAFGRVEGIGQRFEFADYAWQMPLALVDGNHHRELVNQLTCEQAGSSRQHYVVGRRPTIIHAVEIVGVNI